MMDQRQTDWLKENRSFSVCRPLGIVSSYTYADKGYLMPGGKFVQGKMMDFGFGPMISSQDTLYTDVRGAVAVGRKVSIC